MEFGLSSDQRLLKESLDRFTLDRYGPAQRRASMAEPNGWSREIWSALCALGLGRMPFEESRGGLGFGGAEIMLVGDTFGRGLVVEPYLSSVVLAGTAIAAAEPGAQTQSLLEGVMDGEMIAALAIGAEISAKPLPKGWRLDGVARQVLGANPADVVVFPVGDAVFVLPASARGLSRRSYRLHGGGMAADFELKGVDVAADARLQAEGAAERAVQAGICFLAAEASGAMAAALDMTVEHLKTRVQFGAAIGSNQALQHRAAEMLVEVEQARSAAMYAAVLWDEPDPAERARGFAAVKAVVGKSGRFVAQNAVQLFGGVGVSEEHMVSHYFRRLTAIELLLGGTDDHVARLADLGGFTGPDVHFEAPP